MIRGTTPTHRFQIPFHTDEVRKLRVWYKQDDELLVTKTEEDAEMEGNVIKVTLTQEETLKFKENKMVKLQLKVKTVTGATPATPVIKLDPQEVLDDEVL